MFLAYYLHSRQTLGNDTENQTTAYSYTGLGYLIANEWITKENNYGYTGLSTSPNVQIDGVVICDRHDQVTGNGYIKPMDKGHTTGGTTGGATPAVSSQ